MGFVGSFEERLEKSASKPFKMASLRLFWGFLGLESGLLSWHTLIHAIYNYDHHILVLFRMSKAQYLSIIKIKYYAIKNGSS